MRGLRRWIGVGAALGVIAALVPVVRGSITIDAPLRKLSGAVGATPKSLEPPKLEGLDLLRLDLRPQRVMAPLKDGQVAELTLDPGLQRVARAQMQKYKLPRAASSSWTSDRQAARVREQREPRRGFRRQRARGRAGRQRVQV